MPDQPVEITQVRRLVEPQLGAQRRDRLRRRALPQRFFCSVARQQRSDREHDDRHEQQRQRRRADASCDECEQLIRFMRAAERSRVEPHVIGERIAHQAADRNGAEALDASVVAVDEADEHRDADAAVLVHQPLHVAVDLLALGFVRLAAGGEQQLVELSLFQPDSFHGASDL